MITTKKKYITLAQHRGSSATTFHGAKRYLLDYHKTQWQHWRKEGFDCWADMARPKPTRHDYYTAKGLRICAGLGYKPRDRAITGKKMDFAVHCLARTSGEQLRPRIKAWDGPRRIFAPPPDSKWIWEDVHRKTVVAYAPQFIAWPYGHGQMGVWCVWCPARVDTTRLRDYDDPPDMFWRGNIAYIKRPSTYSKKRSDERDRVKLAQAKAVLRHLRPLLPEVIFRSKNQNALNYVDDTAWFKIGGEWEHYQFDLRQTPRRLAREVREAISKRQEYYTANETTIKAQQRERRRAEKCLQIARTQPVLVQFEHSVKAGNCAVGTREFADELGYPADIPNKDLAAPSNWLLQQRDDTYTQRACVLAVLLNLTRGKRCPR